MQLRYANQAQEKLPKFENPHSLLCSQPAAQALTGHLVFICTEFYGQSCSILKKKKKLWQNNYTTNLTNLNFTGKVHSLSRICLNLQRILHSLQFKWANWFLWLIKKNNGKVKISYIFANTLWGVVTTQEYILLLIIVITRH